MTSDRESHTIESEPHLHPDTLRGALQAMIDDHTADAESIILGHGFDSMGVIGLKANRQHFCHAPPRRLNAELIRTRFSLAEG